MSVKTSPQNNTTDLALIRRVQAGDDRAFERLAARYRSMIYRFPKLYAGRRVSFDEILALCLEAFWKAAISYKPDKGTKFSTYAFEGLKRAYLPRDIYDSGAIHVPKNAAQLLASPPAEPNRLQRKTYALALSAFAARSLDRFIENEDGKLDRETLADKLPDPRDPFGELLDRIEAERRMEAVEEIIESLTPMQRSVLMLCLKGKRDFEIAGELGVTSTRVRQIRCRLKQKFDRRFD